MVDYVRTHLEDQFFKSFGQLVREKQSTVLAEEPQQTITLALQQMHRVENLLSANKGRRHKYAIKIEAHLKDIYRTRTGRAIEETEAEPDSQNAWELLFK